MVEDRLIAKNHLSRHMLQPTPPYDNHLGRAAIQTDAPSGVMTYRFLSCCHLDDLILERVCFGDIILLS